MAGFLPFSIASIGATPHAATDAAPTPQTGAEGAFASVLAEMAGAETGAETGGSHAGSAVQRLKLAFAASDARPATFNLGGLEVKVEGVRFVRSGDASAAGMNAAGMNIAELARLAPQAGGKPEGAPTAEAQAEQAAQDAGEAGQPHQPLPLPLAERPKANAKAAEAADAAPEAVDAPVQSEQAVAQNAHLAALEGAAPKAAAPAAGFGVAAADAPVADVDMAEAQPETESAPRDAATPRVNAQADSRPLTNTAAPGMTPPMTPPVTPAMMPGAAEAAQSQTRTQAQAAAATPVDKAVAATLAALAPAAGQARGAHLPGADGRAADALMTGAAGAGLAGKPEAGDAQAPAQTMTAQTMTGKPAAAETNTTFGLADKPSADPAAVAERARMAAPEAGQQKIDTGRIDTGRIDTARADAAQSARPAAVTPEQAANQTATTQPAAAQAATTALPEGFQPLNAAPGLAQGHGAAAQAAAQPAQPFGAEVVKAPTPQHLPEAMGLAISRHVSAEATEFTLRLDPAELGRVEVKLEMGKDGKATVSIQADNASTFDLLRRDSHALERALAEAGLKLDSGGLNFSLRQQDGQNPQQFAGEGGQRPATGRMQDASLAANEQDNTPAPTRRSGGAGLLDLSI